MSEMTTYTGRLFDLELIDQICTEDILIPLSRQVRYNGHTIVPWTVLQHSLACWKLIGLEGLCHDFHEAYVGDICTYVKPRCNIKDLTDRIDRLVEIKYGVDLKDPDIKRADLDILWAEGLLLCRNHDWIQTPSTRALQAIEWVQELIDPIGVARVLLERQSPF
jgi:hypothetical protein